jgi:phosphohistidine phosphatase
MVVGHNPAMTQLANWLAENLRLDHLPTCGLVCLQFEVSHWNAIQPASGQLTWFDIPKNDHSIL